MAINLGNIRSAGFRKGLATGFIKSEAAKADAERREKEYQQLLAREQTNRDFQAEQSSLSRDASAEQARISLGFQQEQFKERKSQFKITNAFKEDTVKREEDAKRILQQGNKLKLRLRGMAASKQPLTLEQKASLGEEFLEVPNVLGMLETHNVIVGAATKEDTLKNAEGIKDDVYNGRVTVGTITQEQINKYIKAGHPYYITHNKVDKVNTQIKAANSRISTGKNNFTGQTRRLGTFNGAPITGNLLANEKEIAEILSKKKGTDAASYALSLINNVDSMIQEAYTLNGKLNRGMLDSDENKENIIREYSRTFGTVSEGFKSASSGLIQPSKKAILKNAPFLAKLLENEDLNEDVFDSALLFKERNSDQFGTIKREAVDKQQIISSIPLREGISQRSEIVNNLSQESIYLLADISKLSKVSNLSDTQRSRIAQMSEKFKNLEGNSFRISTTADTDNLQELLLLISNDDRKVSPDAANTLMKAIQAANPKTLYRNLTKKNNFVQKIPNSNLEKVTENNVQKIKNEATQAIQEGSEVGRLTDEIIALMESTPASGGAALTVSRAVVIIEEGIFDAGRALVGGIRDTISKIKVNIKGNFVNLSEYNEATNMRISAEEGGAEKAEVRKRLITSLEQQAQNELTSIGKTYEGEERIRRERIVLKKIALTYRMSGLLQGDSSGRTISNADFDIASKALFGPKLGTIEKMKDIAQFFKYRNNVALMNSSFADTGLGTIASRVGEAVNKLSSDELVRKIKEDAIDVKFIKDNGSQIISTGSDIYATMGNAFSFESLTSTNQKDISNNLNDIVNRSLQNPKMSKALNIYRTSSNMSFTDPSIFGAFKNDIRSLKEFAKRISTKLYQSEKGRIDKLYIDNNFEKNRAKIPAVIFEVLFKQYQQKLLSTNQ